MLVLLTLLTATPPIILEGAPPWNWNVLLWHIVQVLVYVFLGISLFAVAYLIVDKATPFDLHKVLIEDKNVAIAIVLAALFVGIAVILSAAIRG